MKYRYSRDPLDNIDFMQEAAEEIVSAMESRGPVRQREAEIVDILAKMREDFGSFPTGGLSSALRSMKKAREAYLDSARDLRAALDDLQEDFDDPDRRDY